MILRTGKWKISPVYSAMDVDVMEDAVEPLSQSLSVLRLEWRLRPGNDSTDSPLFMKTSSHIKAYWLSWRSIWMQSIDSGTDLIKPQVHSLLGSGRDLPLRSRPSWVDTVGFSCCHRGQRQIRTRLGTDEIVIWWRTQLHTYKETMVITKHQIIKIKHETDQ